ncbi:hypothetical protein EVAR_7386_1 [Eumeta japonica]|uniref:Uncharacterized protein n=1 Tax=Eumeta variegata TaxID=151549 RepID=A0A4C1V9E5_EUMVA|nr:hypothetical protein EVAR_7386_1 [Eumeta japonica]
MIRLKDLIDPHQAQSFSLSTELGQKVRASPQQTVEGTKGFHILTYPSRLRSFRDVAGSRSMAQSATTVTCTTVMHHRSPRYSAEGLGRVQTAARFARAGYDPVPSSLVPSTRTATHSASERRPLFHVAGVAGYLLVHRQSVPSNAIAS